MTNNNCQYSVKAIIKCISDLSIRLPIKGKDSFYIGQKNIISKDSSHIALIPLDYPKELIASVLKSYFFQMNQNYVINFSNKAFYIYFAAKGFVTLPDKHHSRILFKKDIVKNERFEGVIAS